MAKEITMPKLSDTMEEGKVLRWLKQEGEAIRRGEIIAEIETDKADMEMEAFDSGVLLEIRVKPGETVPVGDIIGLIGQKEEKPRATASTKPTGSEPASASRRRTKAREREPAPATRRADAAADAPPLEADGNGDTAEARLAGRVHKEPSAPSAPATSESERKGEREGATARRRVTDLDNAAIPGPHADIADVIEPPGAEEEEEGEEGSSRQAPTTDGAPAGTQERRADAGAGGRGGLRRMAPTKGINDRLPLREPVLESRPRLKISPVARRLAQETGLDPAEIEGSGPDGRIVKRDVESALERRGGKARREEASRRAETAAIGRDGMPATGESAARPAVPVARGELGTELPLSKIRRTIALRMTESKRTVPHFYTTVAVRMDEALRLKDALAQRDPGNKVTVSHLIVKAAALAIERFPRVNGFFEEDRIVIPSQINVGLAVAVEDGLIVPVIKDCGNKSLQEIARAAREAVARVRSGKLAQDDLQGGTFSISNMGMFPIEQFAAIITPPQSAILAVGGTAEEPVVRDGRIVPGKVLRLTLSADHRVIDGVLAAAFVVEVRAFLENPLTLVI